MKWKSVKYACKFLQKCNFQSSRRTIVRHYLYQEPRFQNLCLLTFPWKSCFLKVFQFFSGVWLHVHVCVWAHSLCAGVNKIWGHSSLRKGFVVWLEGKKRHVQHFNLSLAGVKLSFLQKPTYHREIWAWHGILSFRVFNPNPLHLWDCYIEKKMWFVIYMWV